MSSLGTLVNVDESKPIDALYKRNYGNGGLDWITGLTFDLKFGYEIMEMDVQGARSIATSHKMLLVGSLREDLRAIRYVYVSYTY